MFDAIRMTSVGRLVAENLYEFMDAHVCAPAMCNLSRICFVEKPLAMGSSAVGSTEEVVFFAWPANLCTR